VRAGTSRGPTPLLLFLLLDAIEEKEEEKRDHGTSMLQKT